MLIIMMKKICKMVMIFLYVSVFDIYIGGNGGNYVKESFVNGCAVKMKFYKPKPAGKVEIPKDNGKTRLLSI